MELSLGLLEKEGISGTSTPVTTPFLPYSGLPGRNMDLPPWPSFGHPLSLGFSVILWFLCLVPVLGVVWLFPSPFDHPVLFLSQAFGLLFVVCLHPYRRTETLLLIFFKTEFCSCCPGCSAMAQSQLTATSASWVQVIPLPQPPG